MSKQFLQDQYKLACMTVFGMDYHPNHVIEPDENKHQEFYELYGDLTGQESDPINFLWPMDKIFEV